MVVLFAGWFDPCQPPVCTISMQQMLRYGSKCFFLFLCVVNVENLRDNFSIKHSSTMAKTLICTQRKSTRRRNVPEKLPNIQSDPARMRTSQHQGQMLKDGLLQGQGTEFLLCPSLTFWWANPNSSPHLTPNRLDKIPHLFLGSHGNGLGRDHAIHWYTHHLLARTQIWTPQKRMPHFHKIPTIIRVRTMIPHQRLRWQLYECRSPVSWGQTDHPKTASHIRQHHEK